MVYSFKVPPKVGHIAHCAESDEHDLRRIPVVLDGNRLGMDVLLGPNEHQFQRLLSMVDFKSAQDDV